MEKILELRKFEQQQAELELGKANTEVARIQNELDSIAKQKASTVSNFNLESDLFVQHQIQTYFYFLDTKKEEYLEEITKAQMIADEKREIVLGAMQNVKALENVRNVRLKEWKYEMQKMEENEIDDFVASRY